MYIMQLRVTTILHHIAYNTAGTQVHHPSDLKSQKRHISSQWATLYDVCCEVLGNYVMMGFQCIVVGHTNGTLQLFLLYNITVTSQWAWWCLKSPASQLFTQPFIHAQIKENIKASPHWLLCMEFSGDRKLFQFDDVIMNTVQCHHNVVSFFPISKKIPHSSSVGARYGVYFVGFILPQSLQWC